MADEPTARVLMLIALALVCAAAHTHTHEFNVFVNLHGFDTVGMLIKKLGMFVDFHCIRSLARHPLPCVLPACHFYDILFHRPHLTVPNALPFSQAASGTKSDLREDLKTSSSSTWGCHSRGSCCWYDISSRINGRWLCSSDSSPPWTPHQVLAIFTALCRVLGTQRPALSDV